MYEQRFDPNKLDYTLDEKYMNVPSPGDDEFEDYLEDIVTWEMKAGNVTREEAEDIVTRNLKYVAGEFAYY